MPDPIAGVHLRRTEENVAEIDALATLVGGRAGLGAVLDDLDRRGRRGWAPGLKSRRAFTWDRADRRTTQWWPQGISTSADASDTELVHGRRLVVTTWYAKDLGDGNHGSRLSFVDLATRRYRHVLLVVPRLVDGGVRVEPLEIHAGGLAWHGPWLHVAATAAGLFVFHVDDIVRVPEQAPESVRVAGEEYRYLLPVRFAYEARTDDGHERLRYSFVSLDRASSPPQLLAGEYGRGRQTRRLAHFALDPDSRFVAPGDDGACRPLRLHDEGIGQAQGVVAGRRSLLRDHVARPLEARLGARRRPRRVAKPPVGRADGSGGPGLLALARRAVVAQRAPTTAVGVQRAQVTPRPLTRHGQDRASRSNSSPVCTGTTQKTRPTGSRRIA